jgi:hypothetical protein
MFRPFRAWDVFWGTEPQGVALGYRNTPRWGSDWEEPKRNPRPASRAKKKPEVSLVRSSAAEYLNFVAASG